MANLTDADKVIRNDVGKSIASKLDDIADAIVAQGGGAHSLGQLSDVDIDTQTLAEGQSIVYNETTQKFENGEVSTVAALDDLTDVSITSAQQGDSLRNDGNGNWINEPTKIVMTQAEWDEIVDKQAWRNAHKNTDLILSDAPNLNATAQDISYDGGADTVWDVLTITDITSNYITMASGYTFSSGKVYKQGKHIFGNIVISGTLQGGNNVDTVGKINNPYRTAVAVNGFCGTSNGTWFTNNIGYIYVSTGGDLQVATTPTGMSYAKIHIDYVTA